jgi:hypothetical protein
MKMKRKETKPEDMTPVQNPEEELSETVIPCNAPAPLVVNGAQYVGCQGIKGHEGNHEVRINWPS